MPVRSPATPSFWPLRARSWCLALVGPALWVCLLALTHSLAGHACDLLARLRVGVVVALGVSLCGLAAVLGLSRLQQYAERDPDARFLLLASGTMHALCAFVLIAQLIPIMFGVSCQGP
jgi:hypothetical protein